MRVSVAQMNVPVNEILVGDAIERLKELPDESVNCCVTSPPYWGLRNYGVDGQIGLEATPQLYVDRLLQVLREVRRVLRSDGTLWLNLGDCYATGAGAVGDCPGGGEQGARWRGDVDRIRDDKRGYRGERLANGRGDQPAILRKKTRALRDGSHCGKHTAMASMGPMSQPNRMPIAGLKPKDLVGMPWRVAFALQADGWWLRSDIIWSKPNPMPESVQDRPTKAHEYIFLLSKSEHYFYDGAAIREQDHNTDHPRGFTEEIDRQQPGASPHRGLRTLEGRNGAGRNKRTVWEVGTGSFPDAHFATFPEKLIEPCILAGSPAGGVVLDPFMGAGTTALVSLKARRQFIGIELNPEYAKIAEARIWQEKNQGRLA